MKKFAFLPAVFLPAMLVLLAAVPEAAFGQDVPPVLMVRIDGKSQPLGLSRYEADVRVFGYLAETAVTMTFANPNDRAMEGDLYFPLGEGATVSGYALDVNGQMVDGVAVEKDKGREVFEKIVRQGIDPGLVEWTRGNNFKTRVFPIPARGSRTIRVHYVSELVGGADAAPAYRLPLNFRQSVKDVSIRVEVVKPLAVPTLQQGGLANFTLVKWRESYVAQTKLRNVTMTKDLVVALPQVEKQNVLVERAPDGQYYFCIHDAPALPEVKTGPVQPARVGVLWDASGSRGSVERREREIELLIAALDRFRAGGGPAAKMTVELALFRNEAEPARTFRHYRGDWREVGPDTPLADVLAGVEYDGGTQLAAAAPTVEAAVPDFYLLFTDGISNFGKPAAGPFSAPVFALSSDSSADHAMLRRLATGSGGQYFNLNRLEDDEVLARLGRSPYRLLSVAAEGASVSELYPQLPRPVAGRQAIVGRLDAPQATVTVRYGFVEESGVNKTFTVAQANAAEGTLTRRAWAQTKLDELLTLKDRNEKKIVALGRRFGLVTPFTSLIVLDSLEQYVEHRIEPPASLPEMRKQYALQIKQLGNAKGKRRRDKLAEVLAMWQDRIKWHDTEFKYPKKFRYKEQAAENGEPLDDAMPAPAEGGGAGFGGGGGALGGMAPGVAEPAAPRAAPGGGEEDSDRLTEEATGTITALKTGADKPGRQPGISIKTWDPDTPYLERLKKTPADRRLAVYMEVRNDWSESPAFYLDCADFFTRSERPDLALRVLSNIAEMELENPALLRVLGHRLAQIGQLDLAVSVFEEVLRLRPEEPQSYRDLALVLVRRADAAGGDRVNDDYTAGMKLLARVVMGDWDGRFELIELIALEELNRTIPRARAAGITAFPIDKRLVALLDLDVRIVMTWHADNTDIDLHVVEPSTERAFYSHNRTTIGGLVSEDFTGGYGPEEYLLRRAMPGVYKIEANFYGSDEVKMLGAVTVQVDVYTNYGRENEQRKSITVRLEKEKDDVTIGEIEF